MAVILFFSWAPVAMTVLVELKAFAESIAMNSEFGGGFGEVMLASVDDAENKIFFEFLDGFFKEDPARDHLINNGFEF